MSNTRGAWKNTNLYFFTPDIENLCKDAAVWGGPQFRDSKGRAGAKPGLEHWRLEQMRAVKWNQPGKLFRGDSYIILNTYQDPNDSERLAYDLHFWVGEESTEDEYGGAMYKTGELDRILRADGRVGAMHREVQDFESGLFLSYYPEGITYMDGGVEGVEIDKAEEEDAEDEEGTEFAIRLFQVKGRKGHIMLSQVKTARSSMNSGDVFVLDAEQAVYQWNGEKSNEDEQARGAVFSRSLAGDGEVPREVIVLNQNVDDDAEAAEDFWSNFPSLADSKFLGMAMRDTAIRSAEEAGDDDEVANVLPILYRMKHTLGGFSSGPFGFVSGGPPNDPGRCPRLASLFTFVPSKRGIKPPVSDLHDKGIFLVDSGFEINVWLGERSSNDLALKIFQLAMLFLRRFKRPAVLPIHIYRQGHEPKEWHEFFGPKMLPNKWQRWYATCMRGSICVKCVECTDPDIVDKVETGTLIADEAAEKEDEPLEEKKESRRSSRRSRWMSRASFKGSTKAAPNVVYLNKEEEEDDPGQRV